MIFSCTEKDDNKPKDYIVTRKDLIAEGVALDATTQTIYISSAHKQKIISIDKNGRVADFVKEAQDDIKSVIGSAGKALNDTTHYAWSSIPENKMVNGK